ncbi:MAG: hypothetical protein KAH21_03905, partial [Spirochaetaceae bacterium]|nr:hypothetical protein [Spirochaetaceae bacterium]
MSSSRQKKKLNDSNPRRNPGKQKTSPRFDRITILLSIVALILLVLVIIFLNINTVETLFPGRSKSLIENHTAPVVERVGNTGDQKELKEPVAELGVPVPPEQTSVEIPSNESEAEKAIENATARLFYIRVSDEGNISM